MSPVNLSLFCPPLGLLLTGGSLGTGRMCGVCPCRRATVGLTPPHMNPDVKIWCSNELLSTWCRQVKKSCFWLSRPVSLGTFPSFLWKPSFMCIYLQVKAEVIFRSQEQTVTCLLIPDLKNQTNRKAFLTSPWRAVTVLFRSSKTFLFLFASSVPTSCLISSRCGKTAPSPVEMSWL